MPRRRRRRIATEIVRPEFPVVVMLVVSFLLFSSYLATFRNRSEEGQFTITLGYEGHSEEFLDWSANIPVFAVYVAPGPNGTVGSMTFRERNGSPEGERIGGSIDQYRTELSRRLATFHGRKPRLYLEFNAGVRYGNAVQLFDMAKMVGFEDVRLFNGYDFAASETKP